MNTNSLISRPLAAGTHVMSFASARSQVLPEQASNQERIRDKRPKNTGVDAATSFSPVEKRFVRNVVAREWRPYLSPAEFALLDYVADHTVEWGREVLDLTLERMIRGVRAVNGSGWTWVMVPCGFTRRSLERMLDVLKKKGALLIEAIRHKCTRISLNPNWSPMESVMSLAGPKQLQHKAIAELQEEEQRLEGVPIPANLAVKDDRLGPDITANLAHNNRQIGGSLKQNEKHNVSKITPLPPERSKARHASRSGGGFSGNEREEPFPQSKKTECLSPAAPAEVARQVVAAILSTPADKALEAVAKAKQARNQDTIEALHTTWKAAWKEGHPSVPCPAWTKEDGVMMRSALTRTFPDSTETRHDFTDFVVRNWKVICAEQFFWMRDPAPDMPRVKFLVARKLMFRFQDAYSKRRRIDALHLLPPEEQAIQETMAEGRTRENALVEVGRRRALSDALIQRTDSAVDHHAKMVERDRLYRETMRDRVKARRLLEEAAQRAAQAKQEASGTQTEEGFPEIGEYKNDFELPPLDLSKWN